jgi:hypothetical protein
MIVYAKFSLTAFDGTAPKGAELNDEITSSLLNLDIEGYEVTKAEVERASILKDDETRAASLKVTDQENRDRLQRYVEAIEAGRAGDTSEMMPGCTVAEAFAAYVRAYCLEGKNLHIVLT